MTHFLRAVFFSVGRALRETGQALDRVGLRVLEKPVFMEPFSRHRALMKLYDRAPTIHADAFVAPSATVIGSVTAGPKCTVGYGAVVRGDKDSVTLGASVAVGDRVVISTARPVEGHEGESAAVVGDHALIGPGALLHACTVGARVRVGARASVGAGAVLGAGCAVGDGAVVAAGTRVPAGERRQRFTVGVQLWSGNPAAFVRKVDAADAAAVPAEAEAAWTAAAEHRAAYRVFTAAYGGGRADDLPAALQERARVDGRVL